MLMHYMHYEWIRTVLSYPVVRFHAFADCCLVPNLQKAAARAMVLETTQSLVLRHERGGMPGADRATDGRSPQTRRPILVEFLGTPGSGKTTVCAAVVSELRRDGFAIITRDDYFAWRRQSRYRKIDHVVTSGLLTWYFSAYLFYFLYSATSLRGRALVKATYELVCMRAWLFKTIARHAGRTLILDEFACNRFAYRLHDGPASAGARANLIRLLALFYPSCNMHLVLNTVPVEVAAERIGRRPILNNRPPKPIEALPAAREQAVLREHMQLSQFMFDVIRSRYSGNAHRVDGAQPVGMQVKQIRTLLLALLSDGRSERHAMS